VIRVLLGEDQGMMRGALALLLRLEPDIDVVAEVGSGTEVVPVALATLPDVALLDIEMPGCTGLQATAALRTALPACKVLIVTAFGRPGYVRQAMEAGASGFLVKDAPVEELAAAIRRVLAGERVVDPALATAALSAGPNPLTEREREVLAAGANGSTIADIAGWLHLSESTVRNYLSAAIGKTGSRNRIEAVQAARAHGWL
jgi:two-component system response regulator DesR